MDTQTKEEMRQELAELETKLDEALQLGMAEFNLFNYMDMLDDEISMLKSQLGIEN